MPKFSVKRPFVIVVGVIIVLILGGVSFSKMTTDLLPNMNLPYMLVMTTYVGASPEKVESEVTKPLNEVLGTVNGVEKVTATSAENYSMIFMEFEDDTNIDSSMVKVTSQVNQVKLPESVGTPVIMEISMDLMATVTSSVDCKGMNNVELSQFMEENVIPEIERVGGVASVNVTGLVTESVQVELDQDKIDDINADILETTNKSLAKAKKKLDKAEKKLKESKEKISDQQDNLSDKEKKTSSEMAKFTKQLNEAIATKASYESQVASLKAGKAALEAEQKAYKKNKITETYKQMNAGIKATRESYKEGGAAYKAIYDAIYKQILIKSVQAAYDADTSKDKVEINESNVETYLNKLSGEGKNVKATAESAAKTQAKKTCEEELAKLPQNVKECINDASKLSAYKKILESAGQGAAAKKLTKEGLKTIYDIVNERIPQIKTALANKKTELAAANAVLKQVSKAIKKATDSYEKVEAGKMTAASAFGSGTAQLAAAKTAVENGQKELDTAKDTYKDSKKSAIKNANLDKLLTMESLSGILTAQNFSMPAGYIDDKNNIKYTIKVGDEYKSIDELKNTLLCKVKKIGKVRLKDVANVSIINDKDDSYAKVNGNDAIILSISKASTAGTSTVSKNINKAMKELEKKHKNLRFTNLVDQGEYISLIVDNVLSNLLWGALLAIIVLFIFLKDIKPTVVVAFSIPLSVLFAVVLMYFTNITLNIMSLSGLALGIGMLVDNSIVVIENIYRLRSKGISAARAAVMGANQVAGAIFSSTLTTICVFMPIVFTTGISRQILQDMCLTIGYSLSASLVVALTVVPVMGAGVLKNTKEKSHRFFDIILKGYDKVLRFCLKVKILPIGLAVVLLAVSVVTILRMGIVFVPDMGSDQLSYTYTVQTKTTKEEAFKLSDNIAKDVKRIDGIKTVGVMMGDTSASMMGQSGESKSYTTMVLLKKGYENKNKAIAKKISGILEKKDLKEFSVSESNMDMSSMMGSGMEIDISGKDTDKLIKISEDIIKILKDTKKLEDISNGQEEGDKEVVITVDKDKSMKYNLTVAQIYQAISEKLSTEKESTTIRVDEKEYKVNLVDERDGLDTDNIMNMEVESTETDSKGETKTKKHKLKNLATLSEKNGVASLKSENLTPFVSVTASAKDGENITLISRELEEKIKKYDLPAGYDINFGGETDSVNEMVISMIEMIALGIALIYLIMVAQFQGLLSPFIVLFTLPLAFTGGLFALLLSGQELSVMSLMGFVVLAGVIVNNGIVFVDYANQLRMDGVEKREALVETGKTRMRPILMTALTTILGMSVMAFSNSSTADMSRGMSIVIIGGLIYGTLMTLLVVPCFYDIFYRKELKRVDLGDEETLNEDI